MAVEKTISVKKPKHFVTLKGRFYWIASKTAKQHGFVASIPLGNDLNKALELAELWNERYQQSRTNHTKYDENNNALHGTLGFYWLKYQQSDQWKSKEPKTRKGWQDAFKHILDVWKDTEPKEIDFDIMDSWYGDLKQDKTTDTIQRIFKHFRAFWKILLSMRAVIHADPTLGIRVISTPKRDYVWGDDEIKQLITEAWQTNKGLACIIATAWDGMVSPVDARTLKYGQWHGDKFITKRAKTGKTTIVSIYPETRVLIEKYHADLDLAFTRNAHVFVNADNTPFSADGLTKAFARVRERLFKDDPRTLADMRRSGAIEAMEGGASVDDLANKMANNINQSSQLQNTYLPTQASAVSQVDAARLKARRVNKEQSV